MAADSRYDRSMRTAFLAVLLVAGAAAPVAADTFGGFSATNRPYLVDQDRLCAPLPVEAGAATGQPACEHAAADAVAKLDIKPPIVQHGDRATYTASASGRTLTVARRDGEVVVTWSAFDPIGKVVEVYASQYDDRVAVAYATRRLGKEVTQVVAFEIVKTMGRTEPAPDAHPVTPPPAAPAAAGTSVPDDPKLAKLVAKARAAAGPPALTAWHEVLALDAANAEAQFRIAELEAGAKHDAAALAALAEVAASKRADAIEWLVEARFDKAFAALRADHKFREAVGLDRAAATPYERVMGFGGAWEQAGTSCEKAEVQLGFARDRSFKLRVKWSCEGRTMDQAFNGRWRVDGDRVVLTVPTKGQKASAKDDAPCGLERAGDEDSLHCQLDKDLEFTVLPTRR
jgi:hypothetical protein